MEDVDRALELGDEIWLKFKKLLDEYSRFHELYEFRIRELELTQEMHDDTRQFLMELLERFKTVPNALENTLYREYGFESVFDRQRQRRESKKLHARQLELIDDVKEFVRRGQDSKKILIFPTRR